MGVSHWWFSFFISESEHEALAPAFKQAEEKAILSEDAKRGLEFWRSEGDDVNWFSLEGLSWNEFLCAFNLPGYDELAADLVTGKRFNEVLKSEYLHRFISINRITPVSILYYALGPERADRLPGNFGNLFLHPREVKDAMDKVNQAFENVNQQELVARALRYVELESNEEEVCSVLTMLPDGLKKAQEEGKGIFFIARPVV